MAMINNIVGYKGTKPQKLASPNNAHPHRL